MRSMWTQHIPFCNLDKWTCAVGPNDCMCCTWLCLCSVQLSLKSVQERLALHNYTKCTCQRVPNGPLGLELWCVCIWRSLDRLLERSVARPVGRSLSWSLDRTVVFDRSIVTECNIQRDGLQLVCRANGDVQKETCTTVFSPRAHGWWHTNVSA